MTVKVTDQQQIAAIETGVRVAFHDLVTYFRDISTMEAIEAGVEAAARSFMKTHADKLIQAIAEAVARKVEVD